jgi:hypothetical protein
MAHTAAHRGVLALLAGALLRLIKSGDALGLAAPSAARVLSPPSVGTPECTARDWPENWLSTSRDGVAKLRSCCSVSPTNSASAAAATIRLRRGWNPYWHFS